MSTMTGSPRAALTIRRGDVVKIDGAQFVIDHTSSAYAAAGGMTVTLFFVGGGSKKMNAGVQLPVERPD